MNPFRSKSFRPTLEALENRLMPTLSFYSIGNTVVVEGDYWGDDNLVLRAFGDGSYSVADGGGATISVPAGKTLYLNTYLGNDTVRYIGGHFGGSLQAINSHVVVDLGEGNDKFLGTFNRDIENGAHVALTVFGEGGNDMIAVYGTAVAPRRSGDNLTDGTAINTNGLYIDSASTLEVAVEGGFGKDKIFLDYDGRLDGFIDLHLSWKGGDDFIAATLNVRQGSLGHVGTADESASVEGIPGAIPSFSRSSIIPTAKLVSTPRS